MAKFVATDYDISINGADFSSSIAAVTLDITREEQDVTAFGNTSRQRIAGLEDASITLDFHQDFGASAVDATLYPLLGTEVTIIVKPTGAAVGATNPSYQVEALCVAYSPFSSTVGDLATLSISWPANSVVRTTGA